MSISDGNLFYNQLIELYNATDLPAIITDNNFRVQWCSEAAGRQFPLLKATDGVSTLLGERNFDKIRETIAVDGSYRLDGKDLLFEAICLTVCALTVCEGYLVLLQPPRNQGAGLHPEGISNMVCSFESRYRIELSGLFSALQAMKQLCGPESCGEPLKQYLDSMNAGCFRLLRSCEWIDYYTRLAGGQFPLKESRVELYQYLQEVFETCAAVLLKKDLHLHFYLPRDKKLFTACDTSKLALVLGNLISNSARASKRGSVIDAKVAVKEDRVHIVISDKGHGIPASEKSKIFDPYYSYDRELDYQFSGNGLGLPIAKAIMNMMDGTIAFTSEEGEGSAFSISFPILDCGELPPVLASDFADYQIDRFTDLQISLCDAVPFTL